MKLCFPNVGFTWFYMEWFLDRVCWQVESLQRLVVGSGAQMSVPLGHATSTDQVVLSLYMIVSFFISMPHVDRFCLMCLHMSQSVSSKRPALIKSGISIQIHTFDTVDG